MPMIRLAEAGGKAEVAAKATVACCRPQPNPNSAKPNSTIQTGLAGSKKICTSAASARKNCPAARNGIGPFWSTSLPISGGTMTTSAEIGSSISPAI